MTRRRWIADEFTANTAVLIGDHADHLIRVLRAQVGQEFDIGAGETVRKGRITAITDQRVEFALGEVLPAEETPTVTLLLAIFKFDRMEWAIEKCTELGVARIIPIVAQRTDSHLIRAAPKRRDRWARIAWQAAEQSRRPAPPEIGQPIKLKEAVSLPGEIRILLNESEEKHSLNRALQSHARSNDVLLAIGPEGGWSEAELDLFKQAGWISASLGQTILRAETAAIAALAVVIAELSENR
jgi:16S rRNA (uracil1498-N3)-methyltransferase